MKRNVDNFGLIFRIGRERLANVVNALNSIIKNRMAIPALSCFKVTLSGETLKIEATDLQNHATANLEVDEVGIRGEDGFAFLLPAYFSGIIARLNGDDIRFECEDDSSRIQMIADGFSSAFPSLDVINFPERFLLSGGANYFTIQNGREFITTISRMASIPDVGDSRPVLRGIKIHAVNRTMKIAAAFRGSAIAVSETKSDSMEDDFNGTILPVLSANYAERMFKNAEQINVALGKNCAEFSTGHFSLISRAIVGDFPNYQMIVSTDQPNIVKISRREWDNAISLVKRTAGDDENKKIEVFFSEKSAEIVAVSSDSRESSIEVGYEFLQGNVEEIEFWINAEMFCRMISIFERDEIEIRFRNNISPIALISGNTVAMVQPLRNKNVTVK